jgi:hypothetical protein
MPQPHAPNRERVDRFTWNRHYFRDATPLGRWRGPLCLLALALPVAWIGFLIASPTALSLEESVTHGELADPHAAWENRCEACHQPSSLADASIGGILSASAVHDRWNTYRCETCHPGQPGNLKDYAPHHPTASWKDDHKDLSCAACHHDHQGRNFSMVKLPDTDCAQCHQDLKQHHRGGDLKYQAAITGFPGGHPEFAGRKKEFERTLKFNHDHHMTVGIPSNLNGRGAMKLADLDEAYRARYSANENGLVQLDCASCHQLAGRGLDANAATWKAANALVQNLPKQPMFPSRSNGEYYLPVTYEAHCQACHPTSAGPIGVPGLPVKDLAIKVPHRLTAKQLDEQIRASVVSGLLKQDAFKGKIDDIEPRLDPLVAEPVSKAVDQLTAEAKKRFFVRGQAGGGCLQCHYPAAPTSFDLKPVDSPAVWFPSAKFNHASHRAMACADCHEHGKNQAAIFNDGVLNDEKLWTPEAVDIPAKNNCAQCHSPRRDLTIDNKTVVVGNVRHGCVDCHRYHNGEHALQGLGSPWRDPPKGRHLEINQLLGGLPSKGAP